MPKGNAMTTSRKHITRRRAGGARPVPGRRPAPRGGWAAVAAKLSAEGAVFAVVAGAITLAVLSQDPGARAATPRPPGHPTCYPPEAQQYGRALPQSGHGVRRVARRS